MTEIAIIGGPTDENVDLVSGLRHVGLEAALMTPSQALATLESGDTALVRLDVLPTLDGVEPELELIPDLEALGIRVLNRTDGLLAAHDKLQTAARLVGAGLPHPPTQHLLTIEEVLELSTPIVLKPRFGSWGSDVWRCRNARELRRRAGTLAARSWFRRHGVLAQELVPPPGHDLRILVAGGKLAGAAERVAAPGEWRTNVAVGGSLEPAVPPPDAVELGLQAAAAIGADLVGVDLLPVDGGFIVLELNGAVDFSEAYSLPGGNVYEDVAAGLGLLSGRRAGPTTRAARLRARCERPAAASAPAARRARRGCGSGSSPR